LAARAEQRNGAGILARQIFGADGIDGADFC
jgi:hypothetical protein